MHSQIVPLGVLFRYPFFLSEVSCSLYGVVYHGNISCLGNKWMAFLFVSVKQRTEAPFITCSRTVDSADIPVQLTPLYISISVSFELSLYSWFAGWDDDIKWNGPFLLRVQVVSLLLIKLKNDLRKRIESQKKGLKIDGSFLYDKEERLFYQYLISASVTDCHR